MSVDRMCSTLAGAERLVSRGGQFIERTPRVLNSVNRITERLQMLSRAEQAAHAINTAQNLSGRARIFPRFNFRERYERIIEESSEAVERVNEAALENLQQLGEAGLDLLQAAGCGVSGDLGGAYEKAADAAWKIGEVWWRSLGGPGNN